MGRRREHLLLLYAPKFFLLCQYSRPCIMPSMPDEAYSILYLLVVRHLLLTGDKTVESGTLFSSRKVYWPFLGSMMAESQQVGGYQTDQSQTQLLHAVSPLINLETQHDRRSAQVWTKRAFSTFCRCDGRAKGICYRAPKWIL